jgi:hypothetical protein
MIETTKSQLAKEYWEKGYVAMRGLFSPEEIAGWKAESDRLLQQDWVDPNNIRTPYRMNSTIAPERIDPVFDVSPLFQKLMADERILSVLQDIFGEEALLFKDKLILKLPGVEGYTMHQDWAWGWQDLCPADEILSVSIQIDGADASNGCIELFPDYHHKLLTPAGVQTNFRAEEIAEIDLSTGVKMETQSGDILIFHALTPHQSGRNNAAYSRRSLYLTYNAKRAGDLKAKYYDDYKGRIGGGDKFFR